MDARTRFSTRIVGGLPVVAAYLDEVGIGRIVDEVVPWEGDVPLGTLVEILIVNRLLEPKALYGIGSWAEKASVTDYYGLAVDQLNDDRLGRALERIAEHGEAVQVPLVVSAIKKFRLKVNQVHYDTHTQDQVELQRPRETFERSRGTPSPFVYTLIHPVCCPKKGGHFPCPVVSRSQDRVLRVVEAVDACHSMLLWRSKSLVASSLCQPVLVLRS